MSYFISFFIIIYNSFLHFFLSYFTFLKIKIKDEQGEIEGLEEEEEEEESEKQEENNKNKIKKQFLINLIQKYKNYNSKIIKIQKFYRGYSLRSQIESNIKRVLVIYSKEVDKLELLLRRGISIYYLHNQLLIWLPAILLLNGSTDSLELRVKFPGNTTENKTQNNKTNYNLSRSLPDIIFQLKDIAEVTEYSITSNSSNRSIVSNDKSITSHLSGIISSLNRKCEIITIIGFNQLLPSIHIAVESSSICLALVYSLRVVDIFLSFSFLSLTHLRLIFIIIIIIII